ncbi:hypothetical protein Vadar_015709 [Vaccinium darrowii]|uniref:Uncharacterized protein n=1 Tax=Vaccinium darrowii TaxID=229202 RepID=A0ACB7YLV6_9ERIC|nr:hypothetical protein Vadar_015709 [Vaccinium darrowii]
MSLGQKGMVSTMTMRLSKMFGSHDNNLKVQNLTVLNNQQMRMAFTSCVRVPASHLRVLAPESSPNTDGIHISASTLVQIKNSVIRTVLSQTSTTIFVLSSLARWASIRLGINKAARVERIESKNEGELQLVGEPTGEYYDVVMFFRIMDILQDYDMTKKLEHTYKSIQYEEDT